MKQNNEKSTKIIIGISFIVMVIMAAVFGYGCKSANTKETPLKLCLSIGVTESWWSKEPPKDSAFIDKCKRYHREILVDKYKGKLSIQSKLLYIETGQSPAQVVYIRE